MQLFPWCRKFSFGPYYWKTFIFLFELFYISFSKYWPFSNLFEPLSTFLNSYVRFKVHKFNLNPAAIYMFKVSNRNTRTRFKLCSKLTTKTLVWYHWHRSGVFIVNSKHISHLALLFLFLTLNSYIPAGNVPLQKQWNAGAHPEPYQKLRWSILRIRLMVFSH